MSLSGAVPSSHSTPGARNPPNTTAPNTVMIYPLPSHIVLLAYRMALTSRLFHAGLWCKSLTRTDVIHRALHRRSTWLSALAASRGSAIRSRGFTRGVAQLGSALPSGRRGRGVESRHPDCVLAGPAT